MKAAIFKRIYAKLKPIVLLVICPLILAGILAVSIISAGVLFTGNVKTVLISDGCALYELTTECATVGEALSVAGIVVGEDEVLNCKPDDDISKIDIIYISGKIEYGAIESSGIDTLIRFIKTEDPSGIIDVPGPASDSENTENIPENTEIPVSTPTAEPGETPAPEETPAAQTHEPVITLEYEDIPEEVGFGTKYIEDTDMYEGDTRVAVKGENGIITHVYEITMVDGVEVSRRLVKTKETKAPVDEVIAYGTISNFINSRGMKIAFSKHLDGVATAYTYSEKWHDILYYGDQLGGLRARWGVIAVDPNVIPLGTKVYVKSVDGSADYGFAIAADIGGSIKGNKIDLWMDNAEITFMWGVRSVEIYILADQSIDIFALRQNDTWG